jgi:hypothetical protein
MQPVDIIALVLTSTRMHALLRSLNYTARISRDLFVYNLHPIHPDLINWYTTVCCRPVCLIVEWMYEEPYIPYITRQLQYVLDTRDIPPHQQCQCMPCYMSYAAADTNLATIHRRIRDHTCPPSVFMTWLSYPVFTRSIPITTFNVILEHLIQNTPATVVDFIARSVDPIRSHVRTTLTDPNPAFDLLEQIVVFFELLSRNITVLTHVAAQWPGLFEHAVLLPVQCLQNACVFSSLTPHGLCPPDAFVFLHTPLIRRMLLIDPPLVSEALSPRPLICEALSPRPIDPATSHLLQRSTVLRPLKFLGPPPPPRPSKALLHFFHFVFRDPGLSCIHPIIQHMTAPVHRALFSNLCQNYPCSPAIQSIRDQYQASL